jgi:hypothetical protein
MGATSFCVPPIAHCPNEEEFPANMSDKSLTNSRQDTEIGDNIDEHLRGNIPVDNGVDEIGEMQRITNP